MIVYVVTEHYKAQTEVRAIFYTRAAADEYAATLSPADVRVTEHAVHTSCAGWAHRPTNWWT